MEEFEKDLARLINHHNIDGKCSVPDYMLAEYVCHCIRSFETWVNYVQGAGVIEVTVPVPMPLSDSMPQEPW